MDYILSCDVCNEHFKENIIIPKMLNCGHSFCSKCVKQLIDSSPSCPSCRCSLDGNKKVEDYPTNYYIFESSSLLKMVANRVDSSLPAVKKKIEGNKESLTKKLSELSLDLQLIVNDLQQFQNLTDSENKILNFKEAKKVLDSFELKSLKNQNILCFDFKKWRSFVNIKFDDFKCFQDYLSEIYNQLKLGEQIYSVKIVENSMKYGKISFQANRILFHTLSEPEKPESSKLIWFDDLKKCIKHNIFTFMNLCGNEKEGIQLIAIKMLNNQKASKFITFCTGECGKTYKGHYYEVLPNAVANWRGIFKLKETFQHLEICERIDYSSIVTNDKPMFENDIGVSLWDDGKLIVYKVLRMHYGINMIGKVDFPQNIEKMISFDDASKSKITDCGILFKL